MLKKEDYICMTPFTYTEIFDDKQTLCCSSWLDKDYDIKITDNIKDNFYSEKAQRIRESILDGSYSHCNERTCPFLNGLRNGARGDTLVKNTPTNREWARRETRMSMINFCFDRSCNLACPSCRVEFINVHGKEREEVEEKMRQVNEEINEEVESLYLSGTADPFFSNSYRKFLMNLDPSRYPKLHHIHIHTNGNLWTEQFWGKLHKVHHLIKTCEISMDAACKSTYDIVRKGGDWDKLMENLKFIVTLPQMNEFHFSMVVSDDNYKEMLDFYNLINNIFMEYAPKANWTIFYNKLTDWGTFTPEVYKKKAVFEEDHELFSDFQFQLGRIKHLRNITTNFAFETPIENYKSFI